MTDAPPPDVVARLALASLPGLGPARARWLLGGPASAAEVVARLAAGALPDGLGPPPPAVTPAVVVRWRQALAGFDPVERWRAHVAAGLGLLVPGDPGWPFAGDPEPPLVLWAKGRLEVLQRRPMVAVVGCRRCSTIGARVAHQLGRDLAAAGVVVVSGLAAGIDAAAHRGALSAGPDVGAVVGTGADVVYPSSSAGLWAEVAERGLLLGEAPLGVRGQRWRFPARNRLMAALAQVVVVVESHAAGGALHTVTEAERRQVPVLAVPGSVLNPASAGTNQLLFDGAGMARSAADVCSLLGLAEAPPAVGSPWQLPLPPGGHGADDEVLRATAAGPVRLEELLVDRPVAEVALVLQRLVSQGLVEVRAGTVARSRP